MGEHRESARILKNHSFMYVLVLKRELCKVQTHNCLECLEWTLSFNSTSRTRILSMLLNHSFQQYDTLSTGYMSGEAYELPETRMELREPALDPIEEGRGSLGGAANSDDNIFVHIATEVGASSVGAGLIPSDDKKSVNSLTTTSRLERRRDILSNWHIPERHISDSPT